MKMMSEIQDEAYSEACEEIERLKALITRAADELEQDQKVIGEIIVELRKAAG